MAKSSFKVVDYHAAILGSTIKSAYKYCAAVKSMLEAHGWTEDEYIHYVEKASINGYQN